jgi:phospholipid/cholesterol/gamma-HCH transport system ATP-binding protein
MSVIDVQGVHKTLGGKHVLRGVDLSVEKGETMVIIGRSGCGKSVLLKHIVGLLAPDSGRILIEGVDINERDGDDLYEVRKRMGMLFQGAALFDSMTVAENVSLGLREHRRMSRADRLSVAKNKLAAVGLADVDDKMPADLSGGMKKRVGLARAVAMDPDFVFYDEPTTGLDPIMADVINDLIINTCDTMDVTSLVVTHDMTSAYKVGDRIAMLHEGEIIFVGTPDEVRKTDNPYVRQFIHGEAEGPIKTL